jgi:hypothetical protein
LQKAAWQKAAKTVFVAKSLSANAHLLAVDRQELFKPRGTSQDFHAAWETAPHRLGQRAVGKLAATL